MNFILSNKNLLTLLTETIALSPIITVSVIIIIKASKTVSIIGHTFAKTKNLEISCQRDKF